MVAFGYIDQRKVQILFDQGSVASYVNKGICKDHKIPMEPTKQMATIANQAVQTLKVTTNPFVVLIKKYVDELRLAIRTLNHHVILGKTWCEKHDATLDHKINKVFFKHHEKIILIIASAHRHTELVSQNTIQTDIRNGAPTFAVLLKPSENRSRNNPCPNLKHLLKCYADLFPDKIS